MVSRTAPSSAETKQYRPHHEGKESPGASGSGGGLDLKYTEGHFPAFSGGWRWVYRKRAVAVLKEELYREDSFVEDMIRKTLGLAGSGNGNLADEIKALASEAEGRADAEEAEALGKILTLYDGDSGVRESSRSLSHEYSGKYRLLAKFLTGYHYERIGFYPEAQGYYSVVLKDAGEGPLRSAALFASGRLSYMEGRFGRAKRLLQKSLDESYPGSRIWLANTLLIKGEAEGAMKLYNSGPETAVEALDPITAMSLADMLTVERNYDRARSYFTFLHMKYEKDPFLDAFFAIKSGDVLLAEGRRDEALKAYSGVGDRYKTGEGWVMSGLASADVLVNSKDGKSLSRALDIYDEIAGAGLPGSDYACLGLASVQVGLGKYEDAMATSDKFSSRYPDSPLRAEMNGYRSDAVSRLLDSLYASGNYLAVSRLYARYGASIPFGKKAEGYLKAGRSFAAIGLLPDAVNRLNSAINIGRDDVVEEAMITLARIYVRQGDAGSAERLLNGFIARFPKSAYKAEAQTILFKAAFDRGEYDKVGLAKNPPAGGEGLLLKARALARLGRHKDALVVYEQAASELQGKGDRGLLVKAYLGAADANFTLGRYAPAVRWYRKSVDAMEGGDNAGNRSWALYRIGRSYSLLKDDSGKEESLKELTGIKSEFGAMAAPVLKEAGGI